MKAQLRQFTSRWGELQASCSCVRLRWRGTQGGRERRDVGRAATLANLRSLTRLRPDQIIKLAFAVSVKSAPREEPPGQGLIIGSQSLFLKR